MRKNPTNDDVLSTREAAERLPIARFDDAALIGFEPEAGFADAYLVASGFAPTFTPAAQ